MFARLLIANRGEIACRVMATARRLGIRTIAVYSDADAGAKHVREADMAVRIGPSPAQDSYLNIEALLAAAEATGADAVHPGYGFLSESAAFADAVQTAGLIWVGPAPDTIRSMGLKDQAKAIAEAASVPVLPGYRGAGQDGDMLRGEAESLGYPLLIKAVAGGGGRGIRAVMSGAEFDSALESARREAEAAFGDGRVMLEKLITQPRHIEVQIFGDGHGQVVHLYERDCSLQRRRQKVIEEAPAPNMPEDVRAAMCEAAVRLARTVSYRGAGTVEFIVDGSRPLSLDSFWFLEMNTRLQVEHPVTEAVTGIDLVAWQLAIAAGDGLPVGQEEIRLTGHAIEARICAEAPEDGFRPGAGLIEAFALLQPDGASGARWDTGFESGDRVPSHYDSMLAKLILTGPDRTRTIARLGAALDRVQLVGVPSNAGFLKRCVSSPAFAAGTHHVNWIETQGAALTAVPRAVRDAAIQAACAVQLRAGDASVWSRRDGWRMNAADRVSAAVATPDDVVWHRPAAPLADQPAPVLTLLSPRRFAVTVAGESFLLTVPDYEAEAEAIAGGNAIKAPMPGKIIAIPVRDGDTVSRGQTVLVMEAMKMEHSLAAPRDGVIAALLAAVGDQVGDGAVLAHLVDED
jgi:acetyl/propionyl-CoA carboxylase alpha subunit